MTEQCEFYKKHELGQIDDIEFDKHLQSCEFCKAVSAEDAKLLELAQSLKQPIGPDNVWERLESDLSKEKSKNIIYLLFANNKVLIRIAAVLLIGAAIGFYFVQNNQIPDKGVVTMSMLEKLDEKEQDYLESIEELEAVTQEKMEQMDIGLMLLYRDKLEMIDEQISECKEALSDNPANAHIHKYLFAALKEKKETLKEIYKIETNKLNEDS
ncbi:MAG: hypothetical protein P8Y99_14495 [Calditrichaceae bacterium]